MSDTQNADVATTDKDAEKESAKKDGAMETASAAAVEENKESTAKDSNSAEPNGSAEKAESSESENGSKAEPAVASSRQEESADKSESPAATIADDEKADSDDNSSDSEPEATVVETAKEAVEVEEKSDSDEEKSDTVEASEEKADDESEEEESEEDSDEESEDEAEDEDEDESEDDTEEASDEESEEESEDEIEDLEEEEAAVEAAPAPGPQASLVVGKVPESEGLWGALQSISTCDSVRNGVLVVFSSEASGRLGIFQNKYITGAAIDSTGETGLEGAKKLLAITSGMFCFRPCFGDEGNELGQDIALDFTEVLHLRHEKEHAASPSKALQGLAEKLKEKLPDLPFGQHEDSLVKPKKKSEKAEKADKAVKADKAESEKNAPAPAEAAQTDAATPPPLLNWLGEPVSDTNPNLRKIMLPAVTESAEEGGTDLNLYRQVLQQEEEKVRKDIERTLERAQLDSTMQRIRTLKSVNELEMLAGMLHSQEAALGQQAQSPTNEAGGKWAGLESIPTPSAGAPGGAGGAAAAGGKWSGLDEIPTPKNVHMDGAGKVQSGAPLRAKKEFIDGCEDLVTKNTQYTDPKQFIKRATSDDIDPSAERFWLSHPRVLAGLSATVLALLIGLVWVNQQNSAWTLCLKDGREHLKAERWGDAALAFTDAIAKDPSKANAWYYRGIAYTEQGEQKKADADFDKAKSLGMSGAKINLARASVLVRHGEYQKALELSDQVVLAGPPSAELYRLRANCHAHLDDYSNAKIDCDKALEHAKKEDTDMRAQILADRGFAEIQTRDTKAGIADFDEAIKIKPTADTYMLRGDAFRKADKFNEALQDYTRVLEMEPRNYNAYVARGMTETKLHKETLALRDFSRALAVNKVGVEALIQRGSTHLSQGAFRLAVNDLEDAYSLNPTIQETKDKLAQAYTKLNRAVPKELLAASKTNADAVKTSTAKLPSDPQQLVNMGYQALSQGNFDDALTCLTEAVRKAPNNAMARRYLAHAYSKTGDYTQGAAQFGALAGLQRLSPEDSMTYAKDLENAGSLAKAVELLSAQLSQGNGSPEVYAELARIYMRGGQPAKAKAIINQGLQVANTASDRRVLEDLMRQGDTGGSNTKNFNGGG